MHVLRNCHRYCTPCHNIQVVRLCIKICMPLHPGPIVISSRFLSRKWWPTSNHLWISAAGMKALFILQRAHPENDLVDININSVFDGSVYSQQTPLFIIRQVSSNISKWLICTEGGSSRFLTAIAVYFCFGLQFLQDKVDIKRGNGVEGFNSCQNIQPTRFRVSWWVS